MLGHVTDEVVRCVGGEVADVDEQMLLGMVELACLERLRARGQYGRSIRCA